MMGYVKNADLTRAALLRLVQRLGYEDITDQTHNQYHPVFVVRTPVNEIIEFRALPVAGSFLRSEVKYRRSLGLTCDRRGFLAWLKQHESLSVGKPASESACPLACWLSEIYGVPYEVGRRDYWRVGNDDCWGVPFPLPSWMVGFVHALDAAYPIDTQVTGAQALTLLEGVR